MTAAKAASFSEAEKILKKGHVLGLLSTNNGGFTSQSGCLEKFSP